MTHNPFDGYRYDNNLVLKVTPILWLIIFWSCHHVVLLTLAAFSKSGEAFATMKDYAYSAPLLLSDLPGIIVLVARMYRVPDAGAKTRWIWRHGIKFLVLGLSISSAEMFHSHQMEIANPESYIFWIVAANVGIIAYLLFSRRVKEIFADFPAPNLTNEESKSGIKS